MTNQTGHGRVMCSCGNVISQCRCPDHGNKVLETRTHPACGREHPVQSINLVVAVGDTVEVVEKEDESLNQLTEELNEALKEVEDYFTLLYPVRATVPMEGSLLLGFGKAEGIFCLFVENEVHGMKPTPLLKRSRKDRLMAVQLLAALEHALDKQMNEDVLKMRNAVDTAHKFLTDSARMKKMRNAVDTAHKFLTDSARMKKMRAAEVERRKREG